MKTLNQVELNAVSGGKENPNTFHCWGHKIKGFINELLA